MWSVSTILTGLYSFMIESNPTLGSIETSTRKKRQFAAASLEYNVMTDPLFSKLFPEYVRRYEEEVRQRRPDESNNGTAVPRLSTAPGRADGFPQAAVAASLAGIAAILSIAVAVRFL